MDMALEITAWSVGGLLMLFGLAGTFLPIVPGPLIIFLGAVAYRAILWNDANTGWGGFLILFLLLALTQAVEMASSAVGARVFGSTKWGRPRSDSGRPDRDVLWNSRNYHWPTGGGFRVRDDVRKTGVEARHEVHLGHSRWGCRRRWHQGSYRHRDDWMVRRQRDLDRLVTTACLCLAPR